MDPGNTAPVDYALSILDAVTGEAGLFTGKTETDSAGWLSPEVIWRAPSEAEAFTLCWRTPSREGAERAAEALARFGVGVATVAIVEIRRAAT